MEDQLYTHHVGAGYHDFRFRQVGDFWLSLKLVGQRISLPDPPKEATDE